MAIAAGLLALALLAQPTPRTHAWRDAAGRTHITNTPPPAGAEVLQMPSASGLENGRAIPPEPALVAPAPEAPPEPSLTPAQREAWSALDQHLARARSAGDQRTLAATVESLFDDSLWGRGLWALSTAPLLGLALLGLIGWWVALGLRAPLRLPALVGFLLVGLALGQVLLATFLYRPQAARLRQNLQRLEVHTGLGRPLPAAERLRLRQRYADLERVASPAQPPWRFPGEVERLRRDFLQVMVAP